MRRRGGLILVALILLVRLARRGGWGLVGFLDIAIIAVGLAVTAVAQVGAASLAARGFISGVGAAGAGVVLVASVVTVVVLSGGGFAAAAAGDAAAGVCFGVATAALSCDGHSGLS